MTQQSEAGDWEATDSPNRYGTAGNPSMEGVPEGAEDVELVVRRIEAAGIDITASYLDWRDIGFALARKFGSEGRNWFHRVSRFYPGYSYGDCDRQFDAGLNSEKEGITIKTFFYKAKNAGIDISPAKRGQYQHTGMASGSGILEVSSESLKGGMAENDVRPSLSGANVEEVDDPETPEEMEEMEEMEVCPETVGITGSHGLADINLTDFDYQAFTGEGSHSPDSSSYGGNASGPSGIPGAFRYDRPEPEEVVFDTPEIPWEFYIDLPQFLQDCIWKFRSPLEKEVFLVGALGVISGCLPRMEGSYFGRLVSPHLYVFVTAPAGAGKGTLKFARELASYIHSDVCNASFEAQENYKNYLAWYRRADSKDRKGIIKPEDPGKQMLFLSTNLGTVSFLQALYNSNSRGILFETEADTLQSTPRKEWGPFSDILRKAFHHETIQLEGRKGFKPIVVERPNLSVVLAGTPDQVRKMMPDTANGLFSRFLFYAFGDDQPFDDPFGGYRDMDLDGIFDDLACNMADHYDKLKARHMSPWFSLTADQERLFRDEFELRTMENRSLLGRDFEATTRRMGLITFRIAMVLTGLRLMEHDAGKREIFCSDQDFWSAIMLTRILEKHAVAVYKSLPNTKLKGARNVFFNALPDTFTRKEYLTVAASLDIKPKTAEKYIGQLKDGGMLEHGFNQYRKR